MASVTLCTALNAITGDDSASNACSSTSIDTQEKTEKNALRIVLGLHFTASDRIFPSPSSGILVQNTNSGKRILFLHLSLFVK